MVKWTEEEFNMLRDNLLQQDLGYKILKISDIEYLICQDNQQIAKYNSVTGLIENISHRNVG